MRKKLLRSRSGFEKPESREEAIMQNILGASNVLEPAESNIEEILQAILYNTPYTKEPETNIEEILLAIKNNGTYTGECESRDMKILYAILNESTYNEEAESRIEELFIEWLYQRSSIKVLEGVPPLTFTSRGLPLINYLIEGNTIQNGTPSPSNPVEVVGVGERTENLLTQNYVYKGLNWSDGTISNIIMTNRLTTMDFSDVTSGQVTAAAYDANSNSYDGVLLEYDSNGNYTGNYQKWHALPYTWTVGVNTKARICIKRRDNYDIDDNTKIMLNTGSTAKPYEPYGYKIPVTCGGVTTDIYIGYSPLYAGDTISMADTGIEIPTVHGNNTLTVDTTVKPSNVYIEYK